jgi:hypothetical protein
LRPLPGPDAQKGQISPSRKGLKVAAGMRNPVHFMERVRKIRDPRHSSAGRFTRNLDCLLG